MSEEEIELISRTTYPRKKHTRAAAIAKVVFIWLFAFTANIGFIFAMYDILPDRPVLRWFLIIVFTYVWVSCFDEITERIALKKSPRNGHSRRGQR